ncbi:MAG TPA: redoxin domain-containing protein [Candidatus Thiothrix moscowensis]|uniref:glutathione peroxidase n=1 Tax=unclassified Thiothrix TaxID=2636184 RepID=UPI0025D9049E|nr:MULTISPECIES: redoxin domain-containing protein [unclassified Thiothrix]HRJ53956.1 redoxin domain-containing protein [Candidatus Thiothrix moscowensis]HRJ94038.1 redoxin domain-containing protein [Candidatus Thiothrix moscowensis]
MLKQFLGLAMSFFAAANVMAEPVQGTPTDSGCPAALNFTLRELGNEQEVNLCKAYLGKVVVIVNTASKCGFTGQFEGLEKLYSDYKDKGLVVLGFPSNDFAGQDPGSEQEIKDFCQQTYGVKFPMFEKTHAAKANASPLYKTLGEMAGEYPAWNFHKYVLNTKGELIGSFSSFVTPQSDKLVKLIEANLPAAQ